MALSFGLENCVKAYCINLDDRPDRLAHVSEQLDKARLPFVRVPATNARDPVIVEAVARCPPSVDGRPMSAGAFACFESHRKCWRRLLESGERYAMVLEDDVLVADGAAAHLQDGWVPQDADLVRLETFGTRLHLERGLGVDAGGGRRLQRLHSGHAGSAGYVITAGAARRLLQETDAGVSNPIDLVLFGLGKAGFGYLVVYQMVPAPIMQGDRLKDGKPALAWSGSSIHERFSGQGGEGGPRGHENGFGRLKRRLGEEWRARRRGTRYVVIPHG